TSMRLVAYVSRPRYHLQTLPLPLELPDASRASYYLHNSLRAASKAPYLLPPNLRPPPELRACCLRAFNRFQSFLLPPELPATFKASCLLPPNLGPPPELPVAS